MNTIDELMFSLLGKPNQSNNVIQYTITTSLLDNPSQTNKIINKTLKALKFEKTDNKLFNTFVFRICAELYNNNKLDTLDHTEVVERANKYTRQSFNKTH